MFIADLASGEDGASANAKKPRKRSERTSRVQLCDRTDVTCMLPTAPRLSFKLLFTVLCMLSASFTNPYIPTKEQQSLTIPCVKAAITMDGGSGSVVGLFAPLLV